MTVLRARNGAYPSMHRLVLNVLVSLAPDKPLLRKEILNSFGGDEAELTKRVCVAENKDKEEQLHVCLVSTRRIKALGAT